MGAATDIKDILDLSQFQSIETAFTVLKNQTTRTEVENLDQLSFVSFESKGFVFETSKTVGSKGHNLMIQLEVKVPKPDGAKILSFSTTAVIKEVEPQDDGCFSVEVELVQFEEKSWQAIAAAFTERQAEIFEFLKAAKG